MPTGRSNAYVPTSDVVTVTEVGASSARGRTQYGGMLTMPWANGRPETLPKVGESWHVQQYAPSRWRFVTRCATERCGRMGYAMLVDAVDALGRERPVADDLIRSGVDSAYVVVADQGVVSWGSEVAGDLGLTVAGNGSLGQFVDRLVDGGVSVTLVIGSTLWGDATDESLAPYQQGVMSSNGRVTQSRLLSPFGARGALCSLVAELRSEFDGVVTGLCLSGFSLDGERADFSQAAQARWVALGNAVPSPSLASWDGESATWWGERAEWDEFQQDGQRALCEALVKAARGWPVSCIVSPYVTCIGDGATKIGARGTGIADDFSTYGWSRVGYRVDYRKQADMVAEMRSVEELAAHMERFSRGCSPVHVVGLSGLASERYAPMMEVLSRYGASEVLLDGYREWRSLPDASKIALSDAMDKYRVGTLSDQDSAGVLISTLTASTSRYMVTENVRWRESVSDICGEVLDKLPHRLKVLFDEDVSGKSLPSGLSLLVVPMADNMTDDTVDLLTKMGVPTVFVGRCGRYVGGTLKERQGDPVMSAFGMEAYGSTVYHGELRMGEGVDGPFQSGFFVDESVNADMPAKGDAVMQTNDGEQVPVAVSGRSALIGFDATESDMVVPMVGAMAMRACGRDD